MATCEVLDDDQFSCEKCTTKATSRFDDSYCSILTSRSCDRCLDIDPVLYNKGGSPIYYEGEICMADAYFKFCYNPDLDFGTCTKFNAGCNGCCLPVNKEQNICLKTVPDDSLLCPLADHSNPSVLYANSTVEQYCAFSLSVSVVTFLSVCAFITLLVLQQTARLPTVSDFAFIMFIKIAVTFFALLLIIQASLCSSFYCSPLNEAALTFIVLSLLSLLVLGLEFRTQKVTFAISKLFPDGRIQVQERRVHIDDPDNIRVEHLPPVASQQLGGVPIMNNDKMCCYQAHAVPLVGDGMVTQQIPSQHANLSPIQPSDVAKYDDPGQQMPGRQQIAQLMSGLLVPGTAGMVPQQQQVTPDNTGETDPQTLFLSQNWNGTIL